ncbi:MAG: hypothetical protein IJ643_11410 [Eubacterium sp.]|nr:hypothetical protein [Eubacterium sp.]MBR1532653.1 hypothetical protein [Eubacterium sp.]
MAIRPRIYNENTEQGVNDMTMTKNIIEKEKTESICFYYLKSSILNDDKENENYLLFMPEVISNHGVNCTCFYPFGAAEFEKAASDMISSSESKGTIYLFNNSPFVVELLERANKLRAQGKEVRIINMDSRIVSTRFPFDRNVNGYLA